MRGLRRLQLRRQHRLRQPIRIAGVFLQRDQHRHIHGNVATADAEKLVNTARSSLYKQKIDLFGREGDSYLRFILAQSLNPEMRLRLFQSGPGTFWTNMANKDMNMFFPVPTDGQK